MMSRTLLLSDGLTVRALEAGQGAPVLLIHGVGLRAEVWAPQIAALSQTHRVIAVDMPGHGESDPLPAGARLPDYVAWGARVIDALDAGPIAVAGHSMGSLIAAGLAVEHPALVERVALISGVHRRGDAARAAVIARAHDIAAGRGSVEAPLARWFSAGEEALRDKVAGWLSSVSPEGYAAAYRAFAEGDGVYADRLSQIACPALVLTGAGDANSTAEMTRTMAAMMPQGRAVVIEGHRHMVGLTAPDAVNAAFLEFLAPQEVGI
ncbi:alpha/beta fold hydrolase [Falsirhodobacter algicola]|uniref:Alpha/beta fold hydrolase n=1 Tax=Falsirhodobacter algicola TaxID=2692330 RepID=A0A8J8SM68_9RHOB|nr:alpha/beta fold hydrolase [Falsirhodobacter algicola]QUS37197.1 alpha/beta fold hydrolase [Falsirhodobacter algicola]